jgi:hypothetical protein
MKTDDFFVGYLDTPKSDRRFFLGAGLALTLGSVASAAALASKQNNPGKGSWDQAEVREWTGIVTGSPYAMLRTADLDGTPKTVLLSCLGKCGVAAKIGNLEGQLVSVTGSLIQRGDNAMIAVADAPDWIKPIETNGLTTASGFPDVTFLTDIDLEGEILDSKCWFGAMKPSEGKVHKSCASLCIRGGIPPAFFAKGKDGRHSLMIMTVDGGAYPTSALEFVADPVRIKGRVSQWGNLLMLDIPRDAITRV